MSKYDFGWEGLLKSDAPEGSVLKAALFTTYDRVDERLLVEHLLPVLLRINREAISEGRDHQYFLVELDEKLKRLHNKLVIITTLTRDEPGPEEYRESSAYGWIWRSIRHLAVGSTHKAVQHAKLWMLHWQANDGSAREYLEIIVSSANLTTSALKHQVQGAWRTCLHLLPQHSAERVAGWGILPEFLDALGKSSGDVSSVEPFRKLLGRAICPKGITFIASIPGSHSRQELKRSAWGIAGLKKAAPPGKGAVNMTISVPYVGTWSEKELGKWCETYGGKSSRINLLWIDKQHPWVKNWLLPLATYRSLAKGKARFLHLQYIPNDEYGVDLFHEEQRWNDPRWSHAKIYAMVRGNSERLLVTSANFSPAAWGAWTDKGHLIIENFELGVCIEQTTWSIVSNLEEFKLKKDIFTVATAPSRGSALIMWAQAVWNGKRIQVECRCKVSKTLIASVVRSGKKAYAKKWKSSDGGNKLTASVVWKDTKTLPTIVRITCEQETICVPVFDGRLAAKDRKDALPPGIDENVLQELKDNLLFEEYGGRIANDDSDDYPGDEQDSGLDPAANEIVGESLDGQEGQKSDSYSMPVFELSRERLGIVDNWADRVKKSLNHKHLLDDVQILRQDGETLVEAFKRQAKRDCKKNRAGTLGAEIAAQEMRARLKQLERK